MKYKVWYQYKIRGYAEVEAKNTTQAKEKAMEEGQDSESIVPMSYSFNVEKSN